MTIALIIIGCMVAAWLIPALIIGYAFGGVFESIGWMVKK
jgi:hypothetical protein